jgi:tRNA nucleotidyltransferase (CCA-adding enzyme)
MASLVAAGRLHPGAKLCFPGSQEKNLREFSARHPDLLPSVVRSKDIDLAEVTRLIIVDCQHAVRIGRFAELVGRPDLELLVYDHHPVTEGSLPAGAGEIRACGSTATILCGLMRKRGLVPSPAEATLMLMGIYEDTGRLQFPTVTPDDFIAAAWLLENGGQITLTSEIFSQELTTVQVELLHDLLASLKTSEVSGVRLTVAYASRSYYVGDIAGLAHMICDMENLDLLVLVVAMADRVYLVARSRVPEVDVGELLRPFGGGGHPSAASATVKGQALVGVLEKLERLLLLAVRPRMEVGQIMSSPVRFVSDGATVSEARSLMVRYNYSAMPVMRGERLLGVITRKVAEKSVYHGLGDAPVVDVMHTDVLHATPSTPISAIMDHMVGGDRRFVPVFEQEALVGVVTRTDLLRHLHGTNAAARDVLYDLETLSPEPREKDIAQLLHKRLDADVVELLQSLGEAGDQLGVSVFAVGGSVRDLLLDQPNLDIDITVEGDGIFFAETFATASGCRVRSHAAFGTAVIIFPDGRKIDVASTRLEYYESPGVLPVVERASLRHDLYRRDFTINTLAFCLNPDRFGRMIDYFGGQKDLQEKQVRVLHNLSFVEDPTRCFRAVRFEQRLGFSLDQHTEGLLKTAVRMGLVARVGGKRLFGELQQILKEREPAPAVSRMAALGLLPFIHPALRFGADSAKLFAEVEKVLAWYHLLYLKNRVEVWVVYFLALTDRLDSAQYLEACQRLSMPGRLLDTPLGKRHHSLKRIGYLRRLLQHEGQVPSSKVYSCLEGVPVEILLYGLARTGDEELRRMVSLYLTHLVSVKSQVTGDQLKLLGVKPGPGMRKLKDRLLVARLDGEVGSRDEEFELARRMVEEQS